MVETRLIFFLALMIGFNSKFIQLWDKWVLRVKINFKLVRIAGRACLHALSDARTELK